MSQMGLNYCVLFIESVLFFSFNFLTKFSTTMNYLKSVFFIGAILFFAFIFNIQAQSQETKDCNGYFAYQAGTKMELTIYDKKDKVSQVLKYQVEKNTPTANGTDVFFFNQTYDKNGKLIVKGDFSMQCKNGQIYADVRNIASDIAPAADAEVSITGDKLTYPHNLTAGQKLDDVNCEIKQTMPSGMTLLTIDMNITNRKVEGFETVTTPAGTFECVKISYDSNVKMSFVKKQSRCVEYLAKGVGLVKWESFDKKGKKESSQVITKLER